MTSSPRSPMLLVLAVSSLVSPLAGCVSSRAVVPDSDYPSEFVLPRALYVSVRGHRVDLRDDFDGGTVLIGPDTTTVPDGDGLEGAEYAIGFHEEGAAGELFYARVENDGLELRSIGLNGMYHFRANERLQPYLLAGFFVPWADLEDASTDGFVVGDGELRDGFGLQLGVGLGWALTERLLLDVRGLYGYQTFGEAEGVLGVSGAIDDEVAGQSVGVSVGLTTYFPTRRR